MTTTVTSVDRSLRIAIVHASDLGGGAERSVISLHRGLRALGHESTVFVGERRTDEEGVVQIPYVRGIPGLRRVARAAERAFGWQDIYNPSFRALGTLIGDRFDVIHFNSLWGSAGFADIGALPALTRKVPGVITMRENWLITGHCACFDACPRWRNGCGSCPDLMRVPKIPRDGTASNWKRKQSSMRRSRIHVVAISDWLMQRAQESPILAGKNISRIYNGIDLETFSPPTASYRAERRDALGIGGDEVVVLLAGQTVNGLNSNQAPNNAVTILNTLPEHLKIRPLILGPSSSQLAQRIRLPSVCLPFQTSPEEMATCFGISDLTLVTSEAEAFGRIAAESQACGTPVVAFDTDAIPEVVRDGLGGMIVKRGDTGAASNAICELAASPKERTRMGQSGCVYATEQFDSRNIARAYADLYGRVRTEFEVKR